MQSNVARGFSFSLFALYVTSCGPVQFSLHAQESRPPLRVPPSSERNPDERTLVSSRAPNLSELVRFVVLESMKEGFTEDKHWNKQTKRFDGFRIDGLKISKRKKKVQHGFCRRYEANLLAPERNFELKIEQVTLPQEQITAFILHARLKARCKATFAHYLYGVKGANGTTVADAEIALKLVVSVDPKTSFSFTDPLPQFNLNAQIRSVDLTLKDIHLHRIGIIDGGFAELLGAGSEVAIEQLLQNQESRIKQKLQKELDDIQGTSKQIQDS